MLDRASPRCSDERGFTLAELLVVVLIIGLLAAIAIPAFISQTSKANDSAAKTQVGTLQTTEEAYANGNSGSFEGGSLTALQTLEPTLKDTATATAAVVGAPAKDTFEVSSTAKGSGDVYTLRNEKGNITRTCTTGGSGNSRGGCVSGSW
jgi:type IV pilus assembly protein PilA